ncbi:hypothetical protein [Luteolibacter sp. Populi]|uniref:hypothetical protein n=1 Tax=Luteolibacter sp. Populi TaxID=3230487 RepID=UPI0034655B9A
MKLRTCFDKKIFLIFFYSLVVNVAAEPSQLPAMATGSVLYLDDSIISDSGNFETHVMNVLKAIEHQTNASIKVSFLGTSKLKTKSPVKFDLGKQTYIATLNAIGDYYGYFLRILPEEGGIVFEAGDYKAKLSKYNFWFSPPIASNLKIDQPITREQLQKRFVELGVQASVISTSGISAEIEASQTETEKIEALISKAAKEEKLEYPR